MLTRDRAAPTGIAHLADPKASEALLAAWSTAADNLTDWFDQVSIHGCKTGTRLPFEDNGIVFYSGSTGTWRTDIYEAIPADAPTLADIFSSCVGAWQVRTHVVQELTRAFTLRLLAPTFPQQAERAVSTDDIDLKVATLFAPMEAVDAIYRDATDGLLLYWLFTRNPQYDDNLMESLLYQEMRVIDEFPQTDLSFNYIPSIVSPDRRQAVGPQAVQIFLRP